MSCRICFISTCVLEKSDDTIEFWSVFCKNMIDTRSIISVPQLLTWRGGTHSMKVTTYAPPFWPPFFRSLENLYSFNPYILAKMGKMSYFDPYFSSKLGKMYSFDPPFFTLVAFRVDGRRWACLSETWPRTITPHPRGLRMADRAL